MEAIWLVIAIIVAWLIFGKANGTDAGWTEEDWPYYAKQLMSRPEQALYFRLLRALPDQIILAQVQLSRILGVKKGYSFKSWYNRINRMSADFVVCSKDSRVIAVIELDDSSHWTSERRLADSKKDKALTSAGIPIVRWKVGALPDEQTIKSTIKAADSAGSSPLSNWDEPKPRRAPPSTWE